MTVGALVARYGPEALQHVKSLLGLLQTEQVGKVVDVVQQGVEVVSAVSSASTNDNGASQSTHHAKQAFLGPLEELIVCLNGHDSERKDLLMRLAGVLRDPNIELQEGHKTELRGIIEGMMESAAQPANGNGTDHGTRAAEAENIETDAKKDGPEKAADADSTDSPDQKGGTIDDKSKTKTKTGTGPNIDGNPFGFLTANIKKILRRELLNKASWMGMAAEVAKTTGVASIDDVESFVDGLMDNKFMAALENSILGREVSTEGFNKLQEKAFKITKWSVWVVDKMPTWGIQYFPMVSTALKFSMPVWTHIPLLNKALSTAFPFLDEFAGFLGKFQDESGAIKNAIGKIKGQNNPSVGSTSSKISTDEASAVLL